MCCCLNQYHVYHSNNNGWGGLSLLIIAIMYEGKDFYKHKYIWDASGVVKNGHLILSYPSHY